MPTIGGIFARTSGVAGGQVEGQGAARPGVVLDVRDHARRLRHAHSVPRARLPSETMRCRDRPPAGAEPAARCALVLGLDRVAGSAARPGRRGSSTPSGVRAPGDLVDVVAASAGSAPVVLVPHSNAGLAVPVLLYADRRAGHGVRRRRAASRGGRDRDCPARPAGDARGTGRRRGLLPPWTAWWDDLTGVFPDDATRAAVEAEQPRLPLSYFTATLPVPDGWAVAAVRATWPSGRPTPRRSLRPRPWLAGDRARRPASAPAARPRRRGQRGAGPGRRSR